MDKQAEEDLVVLDRGWNGRDPCVRAVAVRQSGQEDEVADSVRKRTAVVQSIPLRES
jgi:hypothetical protein